MATVKAGRIIKVKNTNQPKFPKTNDYYYSIWVEDDTGKNERCLLFTERELKSAEHRASRNKEDLTEKGLIQNLLD